MLILDEGVRRSWDAGRYFTESGLAGSRAEQLDTPEDTVFARSNVLLWASTDRGCSWEEIDYPRAPEEVARWIGVSGSYLHLKVQDEETGWTEVGRILRARLP